MESYKDIEVTPFPDRAREIERELYEIMLPWQRVVMSLPRRSKLIRVKIPHHVIERRKRLIVERNNILGLSHLNSLLDLVLAGQTYFGAGVVVV